ncbi:MAG TPA: cyclodeaminase/cyclohydrolase family protein [Solirubrobacterales bacterium]|nr:cyclodeaminase/cyclohydrolase family protein [Solirubrobacterales bacterium]
MAELASRRIDDALAALAISRDPSAAGVASALTAATAASLTELTAALAAGRLDDAATGDIARQRALAERAAELRPMLLKAADEDLSAYGAVASATDEAARVLALERAAEPPAAIAGWSAELAEAAAETAEVAREWPFHPDAVTAAHLAAAAARSAAILVAANLGDDSSDPRLGRAREATERAGAAAARAAGTASA